MIYAIHWVQPNDLINLLRESKTSVLQINNLVTTTEDCTRESQKYNFQDEPKIEQLISINHSHATKVKRVITKQKIAKPSGLIAPDLATKS